MQGRLRDGVGHAKKVRRRKGGSAGFTLLEVLVAVAILAIALTSLLTSQIQALRATRYAQSVSAAAFLAEYQIIEIEYEIKKDGGWADADQEFEGDFGEQGWPDMTYKCLVDMVELPEYQEIQQAVDSADTGGLGGGLGGSSNSGVQDSQDQAFDSLGIVWPIIKNAVEQSIRKVDCKVYWQDLTSGSSQKKIDEGCCEVVVNTFWTDMSKLNAIADAGGEVTEDDDTNDDGGSGSGSGSGAGGGGGGAGAGKGSPNSQGWGRNGPPGGSGVRGGGGPVTPGGAR
jgi:type II secretion system protein I